MAQQASPTNILATILRWGVYVVALIPLVIFKDFLSPFHFGKVVVFRILIEIMGVLYLALILQDRRYLPRPTLTFWAITFFTAAFGITSLTSINVYQSVMGTLERMGGWFTFFHFWIFYIIAISVLRTREDWIRLVRISVMASLVSTMYGFLQKTNWEFIIGGGGRPRIFGTLGNTALFAGYTIVNMFLALLLIWQKPDIRDKPHFHDLWLLIPMTILLGISAGPFIGWPLLLALSAFVLLLGFGIIRVIASPLGFTVSFLPASYAIIALCDLVAIILTAVRGSLLAVLVSTALFALLYVFIGSSRRIKVAFITLALLLITAEGTLVIAHNTNFVRSSGYLTRLSDVSLKTRLIKTRFWAWRAGIDGWNDSAKTIIFGWGPENFNIPFSKHFNPLFYQGPGSETLFDRAHNMFVEILVTTGLVGFASYISLFVLLFWLFWKAYNKPEMPEQRLFAITMVCGLVAYIIHNGFIFDTSANFIVFFIFYAFAGHLFEADPRPAMYQNSAKPVSTALRFSALMLISLIVLVGIYKTDIKPVRANYATTRAVVASWNGDQPQAIAKFRQALSYHTFPDYELRHRYAQYVLENYGKLKPEEGLDPGKIILELIEEVKKNESYKHDYLPYLYISRFYIILGKNDPKSPFNDLALENSLKALEISPTFVRTYYEVAQAYLNKRDYSNAIATFQKAADLNPEVGLSWWYVGLSQMESGNIIAGSQSVQKAKDSGYVIGEGELLRLISLYANASDFSMTAKLYLELIKLRPNNPQYHASLATSYAKIGNIDGAVQEAKIAAKLDPSFEKEARAFVASLGRQW